MTSSALWAHDMMRPSAVRCSPWMALISDLGGRLSPEPQDTRASAAGLAELAAVLSLPTGESFSMGSSSCRHVTPERITFAGTPAAIEFGGMFFVTTASAPMIEPAPIVTPFKTRTPSPSHTRSPRWTSFAGLSRRLVLTSITECMSLTVRDVPPAIRHPAPNTISPGSCREIRLCQVNPDWSPIRTWPRKAAFTSMLARRQPLPHVNEHAEPR